MAKYYFLASLLPTLEIGHIPSLGFSELKELLRINLTKEDLRRVGHFLRLIDIENLRALWAGEPLDPRGNLNREGLEEALQEDKWPDSGQFEFPGYLSDFLERHKTRGDRTLNFAELLSAFLLEESRKETGFIRKYFAFERNLRFVLLGFRAKVQGRDVLKELTYEDPTEPIIAEIIAQKDSLTFEPPFEFRNMKPIFDAYSTYPMELHKALCEYRFKRVGELFEGENFSIDRILGYMAQLLLVERWLELNHEQGMKVIHMIEGNRDDS